MKNIHILPTDKPSRIYLIKSNNKLGITSDNPFYTENMGSGTQNQHIYIINSEEIKDWYINISSNTIHKSNGTEVFDYRKEHQVNFKIILTDNKDLIKDGVQAIPDEFLEWFVKNPSCEEVEVEIESKFDRVDGHYHDVWEIIIPKEETNGCIGSNGVSDPKLNEVQLNQSKKETHEEVPILAKISHQTDLGVSQWYEVVYYADGKWRSYSGSKTFEDGERVIKWNYCNQIF